MYLTCTFIGALHQCQVENATAALRPAPDSCINDYGDVRRLLALVTCCSHCRLMMRELDSVVTRARMFQHKPDGQVTIMMLQDTHGIPVPTMQDPLHYPHGTKFLAPGPRPVHEPGIAGSLSKPRTGRTARCYALLHLHQAACSLMEAFLRQGRQAWLLNDCPACSS